MEKNTQSNYPIDKTPKRAAANIGRLIVTGLLASAVISVTLHGPRRAKAESQINYSISSFNAGINPSAAKIGDIDGDGLNDIAVVNLQGSLQLFFNTGRGSFERISLNGLWPSTSNPLSVEIGDLNRDGRNDIAVALSTQTGAVSILFNHGNRSFAAPVNQDARSSSSGVAIGDLDQDGDNDLASISQGAGSGILLNDGHGGFVFSGTYGTGSRSRSIALADLNRDGFKDIAYVNNARADVTVLLNNRNAAFASPASNYAGDYPDDLAVADLDGDGDADIAIANSYYSEIFVLLNGGDGSFPSYSELYGGDTPTNIALADFNGDGLNDIAVTSWGTNSLSILLNRGDYSFTGPRTFYVGQAPVDAEAGDLDGDSLPDLVAVNQGSGSITVLFSGSVAPPPPPPPAQITLTVTTRVTSKARFVDLRWSGAASSRVDIYRNGSRITTASNTGSYTDQFARRATGTFRYKVCAAGSQTCSSEAAISF